MRSRSRPCGVASILTLATTLGALLPSLAASQVVEVTTCGQTINGPAVLTANLDCSAYSAGPAIVIADGALDLAGFSVIGNPSLTTQPGTYFNAVVYCGKKTTCEITGPGEITGGVNGVNANRLKLSGVTVSNNTRYGVRGYSDYSIAGRPINPDKISIEDATITANGEGGIFANRCAIASTTIANNGDEGAYCVKKLKLKTSLVTENLSAGIYLGGGLRRARATIKETTVAANAGGGISAEWSALKLASSEISGNGRAGIYGTSIEKAQVIDTSITDNATYGWRNAGNLPSQSAFGKTRFISSSIESNCVTPSTPNCRDIHSCGENLTLVDTTCGSSSGCYGSSLGICSLD